MRTFSRITVLTPTGRTDLSVADDMPVAEVSRLLRRFVPVTADARWVLTHPVHGNLEPSRTLLDSGVLDGDLLYLHQDEDGLGTPYVEDVAEEAAAGVDNNAWSPEWTSLTLRWAAAAWLVAAGILLLWLLGAQQGAVAVGILTAVTLLGIVFADLLGARELSAALAATAVPLAGMAAAGTAVGSGLPFPAVAAAVGLAVALIGSMAVLFMPERLPVALAVATAGALVGICCLAWWGLTVVWLPQEQAAAVVGVAVLGATGFLPRWSAEAAGLGRVSDAVVQGRSVRRKTARTVADRARHVLSGLLLGAGITALLIVTVLARHDRWLLAIAVLLGVGFLLRAKSFSMPSHVLPCAVAGLAALVLVAGIQVAGRASSAQIVAAATAVALVLAALSSSRLNDVGRARLRVALNRIEALVLFALGPLLLAALDTYQWAFDLVR